MILNILIGILGLLSVTLGIQIICCMILIKKTKEKINTMVINNPENNGGFENERIK